MGKHHSNPHKGLNKYKHSGANHRITLALAMEIPKFLCFPTCSALKLNSVSPSPTVRIYFYRVCVFWLQLHLSESTGISTTEWKEPYVFFLQMSLLESLIFHTHNSMSFLCKFSEFLIPIHCQVSELQIATQIHVSGTFNSD